MAQLSKSSTPNKSRKPRNSKPKVSYEQIHKYGGWLLYAGAQSIVCLSSAIPAESILWHLGWSGTLSAACFHTTIKNAATRRNYFAKGCIISFNIMLHCVLLDGYKTPGDGLIGAVVVHLVGWFILSLTASKAKGRSSNIRNVRGAILYNFNEVMDKIGLTAESGVTKFFIFAGIPLPLMMMAKHSFVLGMSETGKSIWHAIMMKFFAYNYTKGAIHDYASNQTAKLAGIGVDVTRLVKTNSFDIQTHGWLISDDCDGKSACKEMGRIPFPIKPNSGSNEYFTRTAADIVGSVIYVLYRRAISERKKPFFDWSDVINACLSRERIYSLLSLFPDTKAAFSYFNSDNETNSNLMSTIRLGLQEFEAISALDHRAINNDRIFSAKRWIESNQIVLLGNERKRAKKALAIYNAAIITVMFREILARETSDVTPDPYIGIFLDELANIERIQGLAELVREARRHGVSVNLANQDMLSLEEKYGKGEFNSIIGQIKNWIILALLNKHDQDFAANLFGKMRFEKRVPTETKGFSNTSGKFGSNSSSSSTSYTWQDKEEYLVMPSEFQGLSRVKFDPDPDASSPMEFVAKIDGKYNFRMRFSTDYLLKLLPAAVDEAKPLNYNPAPAAWEELEPWAAKDYERLCLPSSIFAYEQEDSEPPLLTGLEPLNMEIEFDDDEEDEEDDDYEGVPVRV